MATTTTSPTEHRQTALDFPTASDEEFERGDVLQGAEKLWGAAAHSIAQEREWPHESHRSLKNAAIKLSAEAQDPSIERLFLAAEKFHRHFYHDSMEDWDRDADRPKVHELVRRVLRWQRCLESHTADQICPKASIQDHRRISSNCLFAPNVAITPERRAQRV